MRKGYSFIFFFLIFVILNFSPINAQEADKSLFFVIDVSKSMNKNQLFVRLKDEITKYIKEETKQGDFVNIITFGTDIKLITSEEIRDEKAVADTESLMLRINQLQADEDYTYITGALDLLASQMRMAQKANPNHIVKAFLFTDGKNDPPPAAKGMDWTFAEILEKHYDVFDNPTTYLYILTLGVEPDSSLVDALEGKERAFINEVPDIEKIDIPKETPKKIEKKPKPEEPVKPAAQLDISSPKRISPGENVSYEILIQVKDSNQEALGKDIIVEANISPQVSFHLKKNEFQIEHKSKAIIPIIFDEVQEGKYSLMLNLKHESDLDLSPSNYQQEISVKKFNPIPLLILIGVIIIALLIFLYIKQIPKFPEDYYVINTRDNTEWIIRDAQKFYSATVSSDNLEIDDANFTLSLNKKTGDVEADVFVDGEKKKKVLNNGDVITEPYKFVIKMM
jgi:hypothetical protein